MHMNHIDIAYDFMFVIHSHNMTRCQNLTCKSVILCRLFLAIYSDVKMHKIDYTERWLDASYILYFH